MKAADLPYEVKQRLLNEIKGQVSPAQYDRTVNAVGEDDLLDGAFAQMERLSKPEPKQSFWREYGWLVFWLMVGVVPACFGRWEGFQFLLIMFGPALVAAILWSIGQCFKNITRF